jgi:hypothetical protein
VLKEGGSLNPKFPGGIKTQAMYLKLEGFDLVPGKNKQGLFVRDYEKKLASFSRTPKESLKKHPDPTSAP